MSNVTKNVVILAKRTGVDEPYGLLNILQVYDYGGDLSRCISAAHSKAAQWHDALFDHDFMIGTVNASEANHCREHSNWTSFERAG